MKNSMGFTLVELMIVIAVAGILFTAVFSLLISGFNNFNTGNNRAEIQNNIRLVETIVNNKLRNVECIQISSLGECPNADSSLSLGKDEGSLYYLRNNGQKVTEDIFTNVYFKLSEKNVFELILEFDKVDSYKIRMLINNYQFDINNSSKISLIDNQLNYKK